MMDKRKDTRKIRPFQCEILQDGREKKPFAFDENAFYPKRKRLSVGDYDNGTILIERKSPEDLAQSINASGGRWDRFKRELIRYIEQDDGKPLFLICEAPREAIFTASHCPPRPIAERRLQTVEGIATVIYCESREDANRTAAEYLWHTRGAV